MVPPPKLGGVDGNWGLGPLPVLQTLRGKEPFYRRRGFRRTGDCPLDRASVLGDRGLRLRSGLPVINGGQSSKSTVRTSPQLGSSFLDNREWDSRWFHRPGAALPEFPPWVLGPDRTFGDSQSTSSPGRACSRPAGLALDSAWPSDCG